MIAPCQSSALSIVEASTIASSTSLSAAETASASGTANAIGVVDDCFEDGCSICLEPFSSVDPPNVHATLTFVSLFLCSVRRLDFFLYDSLKFLIVTEVNCL